MNPSTHRDSTIDVLFGRPVADPYRWLEQGESAEVQAWTLAQNQWTERTLGDIGVRGAIQARLRGLLGIGTVGAPTVRRVNEHTVRYFYLRRAGQQNQPVLYVRDRPDGHDRVLVDPNALSSEGTVALDWWEPSTDGRLVVYGLSRNGDEESTLYVRDVESGCDLPDRIERTRMASIAWVPDSTSFYYTRYPSVGSVPPGEEHYHRTVYWHRLGTDPAEDLRVFSCGQMTDSPGVELSPNGRWLTVVVYRGWTETDVFLCDLRQGLSFVPLAVAADATFLPVVLDDVIYIRTNDGAPRYRVVAVDPTRMDRSAWRPIIGECEDVLQSISVVGNEIVATYLSDASSRVRRFRTDGSLIGEIALPTIGSVSTISGLRDGEEIFYDFSSFAVAPTVYRFDLLSGQSGVWASVDADVRSGEYTVERVRARSRDGTLVPMFLVHKQELARSGALPTLLLGYGGFKFNIVPTFGRANFLWLEQGGILAVANLRGGGEFGEEWHKAGMLDRKQNVFDDAIACAEWLIANGYSDRDHLGIMGGSNGGLLVGAVVVQRPDLVRAAVCSVPLLDMLRYHRFRIAKLWMAEYGSPEHPEEFEWLYRYSPYHHVEPGAAYPAVLLTTAESDSRVDPLHARKMTAALQAATSSGRPILLRVEPRAGHGAGKPVIKQVNEMTDVYTFLFSELALSFTARART